MTSWRVAPILLLACLTVLSVDSTGAGFGRGGGGSKGGSSAASGGGGKAKAFLGSAPAPSSKPLSSASKGKSSRSILSAWSIISLIVIVIVLAASVYYFSIFYPLVCAERGKYDVMEMTSV